MFFTTPRSTLPSPSGVQRVLLLLGVLPLRATPCATARCCGFLLDLDDAHHAVLPAQWRRDSARDARRSASRQKGADANVDGQATLMRSMTRPITTLRSAKPSRPRPKSSSSRPSRATRRRNPRGLRPFEQHVDRVARLTVPHRAHRGIRRSGMIPSDLYRRRDTSEGW